MSLTKAEIENLIKEFKDSLYIGAYKNNVEYSEIKAKLLN